VEVPGKNALAYLQPRFSEEEKKVLLNGQQDAH
jgi:hypothetical protein